MKSKRTAFIEKDKFAGLLGVEMEEGVDGSAVVCTMVINEEHLNGHGTVHGAVIFSLADVTFAAACNSEKDAIGIQADIRYMAKPEGGMLRAKAYELNASNKIANYQVDVFDGMNTKIAQFSASAYRF